MERIEIGSCPECSSLVQIIAETDGVRYRKVPRGPVSVAADCYNDRREFADQRIGWAQSMLRKIGNDLLDDQTQAEVAADFLREAAQVLERGSL